MTAVADRPTVEATSVDVSLLDVASRLTEQNPHLPAGLVLRCYARAVQTARGCGVVPRDLARVSEQIARAYLLGRAPGADFGPPAA